MHWHVEGTRLHVLASVHISDRPLRLEETIAAAIDRAEVLAFEANFELPIDPGLTQFARAGCLSENVPADLFADAVSMATALGISEVELKRCRLWWASLRLAMTGLAHSGIVGEHGIDRLVLATAKASAKKVTFLEPPGAGTEPFRKAPQSEQQFGLASVVRRPEEGLSDVQAMLTAWVEKRPDLMLPTFEKYMRQQPRTYGGLLAARNRAWLPKILRMIGSGRLTVVTIGGLHMVGAGSLPELLQARGHRCVLG